MSLRAKKYLKSVLLQGLFLTLIPSFSADGQTTSGIRTITLSEPHQVATFNGTSITDEELRKASASDLDKLSIQVQQMNASLARAEHQILETKLIQMLADKLFEAEAAKRGVTKEALIEKELEGKVKEPSPEDISAFYEANKQRFQQPLDQSTELIRQYLMTEYRKKAIGDLADKLKPGYGVKMLLPPLRVSVKTEGSPSRGPKDAPVTIAEFSDFQCPFCSALSKTLDEVQAKYGDKVRLVYRQFPVSQLHPLAEKAAEASLCAADQNQFWALHDLMFETQNELSSKDLEAKAAKLKLDSGAFNSCLESGKDTQRVQQDLRDGYTLGVTGTPALFINGRYFAGSLTASDLSRIIEEEIILNSPRTASASPLPATKAP